MKLHLRRVRPDDINLFSKWWRSKRLAMLTSGIKKTPTDSEIAKYFFVMMHDKDDYHYMITLAGVGIGHIALIKRDKGWYETQIIIGDRVNWGKRYGSWAIKRMISIGRGDGIKKIYLEVRPTNIRAIRAYEKCGFVPAGIEKYPKSKHLKETLKMVVR